MKLKAGMQTLAGNQPYICTGGRMQAVLRTIPAFLGTKCRVNAVPRNLLDFWYWNYAKYWYSNISDSPGMQLRIFGKIAIASGEFAPRPGFELGQSKPKFKAVIFYIDFFAMDKRKSTGLGLCFVILVEFTRLLRCNPI